MRFPEPRAQIAQEISEAERPGRMRGPRDQNFPDISSHFSLCLCCVSKERGDLGRRSKISESIDWSFLSRAVLYIIIFISLHVRFTCDFRNYKLVDILLFIFSNRHFVILGSGLILILKYINEDKLILENKMRFISDRI